MNDAHPAHQTASAGLFVLGFGIFVVSVSPLLAQVCYVIALFLSGYILIQFPNIPFPRNIVIAAGGLSIQAALGLIYATFPIQAVEPTASFLRMQLIGLASVLLLQIARSWEGFASGALAGGLLAAMAQIAHSRTAIADVGRAAAGAIDLNEYGTMGVILVGLALFAPIRVGRWETPARVGASIIMSISLLSTASRTAALMLILVLTWHFVLQVRKAASGDRNARAGAAVLPGLVLLGLLAFAVGGTQVQLTAARLMTAGDALASGGNQRVGVQLATLDVFLDSPILGHGLGTTAALIGEAGQVGKPMSSHNTFVELAVGFGLLGLTAALAVILQGIGGLWKHRTRDSYSLLQTVCLLLLSSLTLGLQYRPHFWTIVYLAAAYPPIICAPSSILAASRLTASQHLVKS